MNDAELMAQHIDALFSTDGDGRLIAVNERGREPAPRLFVGRVAGATIVRTRCDVDLSEAAQLEALARHAFEISKEYRSIDPSEIRARLERSAPVSRIWSGPAFCFPEDVAGDRGAQRVTIGGIGVLQRHFSHWIDAVLNGDLLAATIHGDDAVSVCCSVRRGKSADEAGVETAPSCRGRGFATAAVTAWAELVRSSGRIPLYSTSWQNSASCALAEKLGLRQFGSDLHFT